MHRKEPSWQFIEKYINIYMYNFVKYQDFIFFPYM